MNINFTLLNSIRNAGNDENTFNSTQFQYLGTALITTPPPPSYKDTINRKLELV